MIAREEEIERLPGPVRNDAEVAKSAGEEAVPPRAIGELPRQAQELAAAAPAQPLVVRQDAPDMRDEEPGRAGRKLLAVIPAVQGPARFLPDRLDPLADTRVGIVVQRYRNRRLIEAEIATAAP